MFGYSLVPTRVLDQLLARQRELEAREAARAAEAAVARVARRAPRATPAATAETRITGETRTTGAAFAPPLTTPVRVPPVAVAPSGERGEADIPVEVRTACERYAWTPDELAANLAHARKLAASGAAPGVIVRAIEKGADVDALFVG